MSIPRFSVNNPIAANFLMMFMLIGGAYYALTLPRELFPAFESTSVNVIVSYPGSTPADVEKGVLIKIEEAIHDLDDLKRIVISACEEAVAAVGNIDPIDLSRPGHRESNPMTAGDVIQYVAEHVWDHANQISEARRLIRQQQ